MVQAAVPRHADHFRLLEATGRSYANHREARLSRGYRLGVEGCWAGREPLPLRPAGYFAADEETARLRNNLGEEIDVSRI